MMNRGSQMPKINSSMGLGSRGTTGSFGNIGRATITTMGIATVVSEDDRVKCNLDPDDFAAPKEEMSLLEYSRTFYIGSIPFMDFIFSYIIIYFINYYFVRASVKKTLIAAIPVTIVANIFMNKKFRIDMSSLIIFIICILLLVT